MKTTTKGILVAGAAVALAGGGLTLARRPGHAADHLDPPARVDPANGGMDRAADIADVYAWHQGDGANRTLVTALTFAGPNAPVAGQAIPCDRNVLYVIHIDNTGDAMPDLSIRVRFAQDELNHCFVRFENLPGGPAALDGRIEAVLSAGAVRAFAGLRDDAFFFDLQGFRETLSTGTLHMINDRDFFAGKNTPAIVVEMPLSSALGTSGTQLRIWGETRRISG